VDGDTMAVVSKWYYPSFIRMEFRLRWLWRDRIDETTWKNLLQSR